MPARMTDLSIDELPDLITSYDLAERLAHDPCPGPDAWRRALTLLPRLGVKQCLTRAGQPVWSLRRHDDYLAMRPYDRLQAYRRQVPSR
jgi:hypothetical protein